MANYATRADIEARFDAINVKQWADLSNTNTEVEITARIANALAQATSDVDDALRGGMYVLPIADAAAATPLAIVDIAARLAAVWLYELRGVTDFNPDTGQPTHKLIFHKNDAAKRLLTIRRGQIELDAIKADDTTAPETIDV